MLIQEIQRLAQHEFGKCDLPGYAFMPDLDRRYGSVDRQRLSTRFRLQKEYFELAKLHCRMTGQHVGVYLLPTIQAIFDIALEQSRKGNKNFLPWLKYRQSHLCQYVRHKLGDRGIFLHAEALEMGVRRAIDIIEKAQLIYHRPGGCPKGGFNRCSIIVFTHGLRSRFEMEKALLLAVPKDLDLLEAFKALYPKKYGYYRSQLSHCQEMTDEEAQNHPEIKMLRKQLRLNYWKKQKIKDGLLSQLLGCGKLLLPLQLTSSLPNGSSEFKENPPEFDVKFGINQLKEINDEQRSLKKRIAFIRTRAFREGLYGYIKRFYDSDNAEFIAKIKQRADRFNWFNERRQAPKQETPAKEQFPADEHMTPSEPDESGYYPTFQLKPDPVISDDERAEGALMFQQLLASLKA